MKARDSVAGLRRFYEFVEDLLCELGMDESDERVLFAASGTLIDEPHPFRFEFRQGLFDILYYKRDMVKTRSSGLHEPSNRGFVALTFEKLDCRSTHNESGRIDVEVGHMFPVADLESQDLLEKRHGTIEVFHGNSDMIYVLYHFVT